MGYAQEGLRLAQKLGDRSLIANTLSTLGDIASHQNDLIQAIAYNQESLVLARGLGDKLLIALSLQNLGYLAALRDDWELAACAQEGLTLMRELGDRMFIAIALHSLGYITARQGNAAQARVWYREGLSLAQEIGDETDINWNLCGLAMVAATEGQFLQAARLFGALETRLDINTDMNDTEREEYERAVKSVLSKMGEKAFAAAQSEGRSMTLEQILATPRIPSPAHSLPPPKYPDGLTEREVQVLCLVAKGLTDEQIAKQLVIAPRTVNSHLTSIYRKIGVSSDRKERQITPRIAAAHYVSEHDLC